MSTFPPKGKSVQKTCLDFLVSEANLTVNLDTLHRFAFWRKGKSGQTSENLDGQKLLGVSATEHLNMATVLFHVEGD